MAKIVELVFGGSEFLERLEPLWLSLFDHHASIGAAGLPLIPREVSWARRRKVYEHLLADPRTFIVIARVDGVDAGYSLGHVHDGADDTWPTSDVQGEVESLAVRQEFRRDGLGTALLDAAEARLAELGATTVRIVVMEGNEAAREFYLRRGMTPVTTMLMRLGPRDA